MGRELMSFARSHLNQNPSTHCRWSEHLLELERDITDRLFAGRMKSAHLKEVVVGNLTTAIDDDDGFAFD